MSEARSAGLGLRLAQRELARLFAGEEPEAERRQGQRTRGGAHGFGLVEIDDQAGMHGSRRGEQLVEFGGCAGWSLLP